MYSVDKDNDVSQIIDLLAASDAPIGTVNKSPQNEQAHAKNIKSDSPIITTKSIDFNKDQSSVAVSTDQTKASVVAIRDENSHASDPSVPKELLNNEFTSFSINECCKYTAFLIVFTIQAVWARGAGATRYVLSCNHCYIFFSFITISCLFFTF